MASGYEQLVFDFLMRPKEVPLSMVSEKTSDDLRRFTLSHNDRSGSESFDDSRSRIERHGQPQNMPRNIPARAWIFDQTNRMTESLASFGSVLREYILDRRKYPILSLGSDHVPIDPENRLYREHEEKNKRAALVSHSNGEYRITLEEPDFAASQFSKYYSEFFNALLRTARTIPESFPSHLHFTVRSKKRGYRIHSTPLYWMSPTVFGDRFSSPVSSYLTPGLYRIGGERADKPTGIVWDTGTHNVTPHNTHTTTISF